MLWFWHILGEEVHIIICIFLRSICDAKIVHNFEVECMILSRKGVEASPSHRRAMTSQLLQLCCYSLVSKWVFTLCTEIGSCENSITEIISVPRAHPRQQLQRALLLLYGSRNSYVSKSSLSDCWHEERAEHHSSDDIIIVNRTTTRALRSWCNG